MDHSIKPIRYNFVMNFLLTAANFIFPLVTFPYVTRVLQSGNYGKISFAASVANYFMMIASLGIPTYGIRVCAQNRDDRKKLSKIVHELMIINGVMTAFVILTYLISIAIVPRFQQDRVLFLINGFNIFLNMFGINWLYQALENYAYITFRSILFKVISIILMFVLVHRQEDYIIYGAISVFAAVGSYGLNFIRSRRYIDYVKFEGYEFKKHMRPILTLFAQSLAVSIYTNLDTVMLGFMKTDVDVGFYTASIKVKAILMSLVNSLGAVLLPRMSYYVIHKEMNRFYSTTVKALNFVLMISIPLVLYFHIYAYDSLLFLSGAGFVSATLTMQIITIAVIPNGLTGILGTEVLTALGREKYVLCSVCVGAGIDFILNLIFIPLLGSAGAALATTIAEFCVLAVQMYFTKGILHSIVKQIRVLFYVAGGAISTFAGYFFSSMSISSVFFRLCISSVAFFGIYVLIMLMFKEPVIVDMFKRIMGRLRLIKSKII